MNNCAHSLIYISFFFLGACTTDTETNELDKSSEKRFVYKNIVILSDHSSRVQNLPLKDNQEISKVIDYFKNDCVKPGEKMNDRSSISYAAFSTKVIDKIDIEAITNLNQKQIFVNHELDNRLKMFEQRIDSVYKATTNPGMDLISELIEKIKNEDIIKENRAIVSGEDTTYIEYENQIHIFTDGYLEYLNRTRNTQFYFGDKEIQRVREYCQKNAVTFTEALSQNPALGLPPHKDPKFNTITLFIHETHERDKNYKQLTYYHPKGLRDNEILEAVWRKWAKESGFKDLFWYKY